MKRESTPCPDCGTPIPAGAAGGLCPRCLMAAAAVPTEAGQGGPPVAPDRQALAAAFPQLEIKELIGQGGMGFVYRARQPRLERDVALKVLAQSLAVDPCFAERFAREGRMLARLNHPNIVSVFDFGQAGPFFYLLMEYVEGVNLRQAMRASRMTAREALAIVPRICEALQYAHDEGVLHRDIKPENILIDAKGRVKIADFGIAKLLGEPGRDAGITATGAALGTPHYMAPEQMETPADVDHRADIYSLGVVFYELLTGELPLGRFAPPSAKTPISERVDAIVLRALARERELRQQSAGEVKTELAAATGSAGEAPGGASPGLMVGTPAAFGVALYYTGLVGGVPMVEALGGGGAGVLTLVLAWGLAVAGFVQRTFSGSAEELPPEPRNRLRSWVEGMSIVAIVMCLPVCGFGLFFIGNLIDELTMGRAGWHPGLEEAVLVPLAMVGVALLPWAAWKLRRAVAPPQARPAFPTAGSAEMAAAADPARDFAVSLFLGLAGAAAILLGLFNPWGPVAWKAYAAACTLGCMVVTLWPGSPQAGSTALPGVGRTRPGMAPRGLFLAALVGALTLGVALALFMGARRHFSEQEVRSALAAQEALVSASRLERQPPVVVETQPASGARDVEPGVALIKVRYSKPMMDHSWSWVEAWPGSTPEVVRESVLDARGRAFWLTVKLEPGRTYAFWLNSERHTHFKDTGGNSAVPYLLVFQTRATQEAR